MLYLVYYHTNMYSVEQYEIKNDISKMPIIVLDISHSLRQYAGKIIKVLKEISVDNDFTDAHIILTSLQSTYVGKRKINDIDKSIITNHLSFPGEGFNLTKTMRVILDMYSHMYKSNLVWNEKMTKIETIAKMPGLTLPIYMLIGSEIISAHTKHDYELSNFALINLIRRYNANDISDEHGKIIDSIERDNGIEIFNNLYKLRIIILNNSISNKIIDELKKVQLTTSYMTGGYEEGYIFLDEIDKLIQTINIIDIKKQTSKLIVRRQLHNFPESIIQCGNKCFHRANYKIAFLEIIANINALKEEFRSRDRNNDMVVNKFHAICEDILFTARSLFRINNDFNVCEVLRFFCEIIDVPIAIHSLYKCIHFILLQGHNTFFPNPFKSHNLALGRFRVGMYNDLYKRFFSTKFVSFLEDGVIYKIGGIQPEHSVNIGFREFKNAAVYDHVKSKLIPILPTFEYLEYNGYVPGLRKTTHDWIVTIYATKFGLNPINKNNVILYTFLIDNLYVQLSNVSDDIKEEYDHLVSIMLIMYDGSAIEELYSNKFPEIIGPTGLKEDFGEFLKTCPNYPHAIPDITPYHVWYLIVRVIEKEPILLSSQIVALESTEIFKIDIFAPRKNTNEQLTIESLPFLSTKIFKNDNIDRFVLYTNLIKTFKFHLELPMEKKLINDIFVEPDYYCFVAMECTTKIGGYMISPHAKLSTDKITRVLCAPSNVISSDCIKSFFDENDEKEYNLKCPECNRNVKYSDLIEVPPKNTYINSEKYIDAKKVKDTISNSSKEYIGFSLNNIDAYSIRELNKLSFSSHGYNIKTIFQEEFTDDKKVSNIMILANFKITHNMIKFKTKDQQSEFNKKIPEFLRRIDMTNIIIAGNMCRSILLSQKIKEIDIFFVGCNKISDHNRVIKLINDLVRSLQEEREEYQFILTYDSNENMLNLLCTNETNETNNTDDHGEILDDSDEILIDEKILFIERKIVYDIRISLKRYNYIRNVFDTFCTHPKCVAFDGKTTYMTWYSYTAYKYMINLIDPRMDINESYDREIVEYYKHGFAIGLFESRLPKNFIDDLKQHTPKSIIIDSSAFDIVYENNKMINDISFIPVVPVKKIDDDEIISLPHDDINKKHDDLFKIMELYGRIRFNNIKYCYIMGEIDLVQISDVIDFNKTDHIQKKIFFKSPYTIYDKIKAISAIRKKID